MKLQKGQRSTPYVEAVSKYVNEKRTPFHMPGHKQGKGMNPILKKIWGDSIFQYDLTEVDGLDYLNAPEGVLRKAEHLAEQAYNVLHTFFLINGSTVGNQATILASVYEGDEIIIPRNAHQSTFSGLILSGAKPIYVRPTLHSKSGMYPVVGLQAITDATKKHPKVKTIHITSPTHCGFTSDTKAIGEIAYKHNLIFLVDEAHGSHFVFHPELPPSAVTSYADVVVQSTHKTIGSLTQTSFLHLVRDTHLSVEQLQSLLRILQSSSPSTLFTMSLDAARQQMAINGRELLSETLDLARYARQQIKTIPGFFSYGKEVIGTDDIAAIDETKLLIDVSQSGYTGTELEKILGRKYKIEIEMSDQKNILCFVTIGDSQKSIEILIHALRSLAKKRKEIKKVNNYMEMPPIPQLSLTPRQAYFAEKKHKRLSSSVGEICGEFIIPFPPDIPIIAPGEVITKEIVSYVQYLQKSKVLIIGPKDISLEYIEVIKNSRF